MGRHPFPTHCFVCLKFHKTLTLYLKQIFSRTEHMKILGKILTWKIHRIRGGGWLGWVRGGGGGIGRQANMQRQSILKDF